MRAVVLSCLLTVAEGTQIEPAPEGSAAPAIARDQADVARLRKELARWQKLIRPGPKLLLFAETGKPDRKGPGEIVRVARLDTWPDDTVTSYLIVVDDKHRRPTYGWWGNKAPSCISVSEPRSLSPRAGSSS